MAKFSEERLSLQFGTNTTFSQVTPERVGEMLKQVGTDPHVLAALAIQAQDQVRELVNQLPKAQELDGRMKRQNVIEEAAKSIKDAQNEDYDLTERQLALAVANGWISLLSTMET